MVHGDAFFPVVQISGMQLSLFAMSRIFGYNATCRTET
jgi:hypothetical protein